MEMWPYSFKAEYAVTIKDDALATEFTVTNTGDKVGAPRLHPLHPQ